MQALDRMVAESGSIFFAGAGGRVNGDELRGGGLEGAAIALGLRTALGPSGIWLRVKTVLGSHFGVGEFTTHFRAYFSGWIGMFTGGTGFGF